ncbi:LysR family transcriptional regulator [Pseudomonas viridiflava]|uniref:LysR family transcriptional regulator n=1 Tax=Pseudomonas viridiflava TaxID=33069 RepID=UPI000F036D31|nr:LysR family transcriptional regulator [Pseudomonas viridiflava]
MDVLNAMQVFVSVVETGSFTNAAQALHMHRPAVSKSIQLLEQRLDGRLLNRSTRRLSMTPEGEAFYGRCKAILENVGEAMSSLGDRPARLKGKLRIDLPVSLGHLLIIPSLMEFQQLHPGIELTLGTSDKPIDLISEGVDCVVRLGVLEDSSLIASGIGYLPMVTCASPAYLARYGVPDTIGDLGNHLAVNYFSGSNPRTLEWFFLQNDEVLHVRVRSAINVNDTQGFVASALAGFGLIQGPALNVQAHLDSGALVRVLQHYPVPSKRVSILYPHRDLMAPTVEVFVDWLRSLMADHGLTQP